ncbi:hypothetical protein [Embleya sp. AB8]
MSLDDLYTLGSNPQVLAVLKDMPTQPVTTAPPAASDASDMPAP